MKRSFACLLLMIFILSFAELGFSKDKNTGERVYSIQNRVFHKDHEIKALLGYITNDDFYHSYPLGISYTYHFNNTWAWEVGRVQIMMNQAKDIKNDLEVNFGVTPEQFSEPKYMIHSNVVYKPFYGKDSVLNKTILNHESYFYLGGGMVNYERKFSYGESQTENAMSISFGYGTKYYISKTFALNFEISDQVNMKDDGTDNVIYLGTGFSFRFNMSPRKSEKDTSARRLKYYLNDKGSENEKP